MAKEEKITSEMERKHQVQFLEAYNKLIQEYGYALQPVLRLELVKIQSVKKQENKNDRDNSNNSK